MTEEERNEHRIALAEELVRECRLYVMAHGKTQDTFHDLLVAIALTHITLFEAKPQ